MEKIYSVKDNKMGRFGTPMTVENDLTMIRSIISSMTPESGLVRFSEDYELVCIATYDQETGEIVQNEESWHVENMTNIKNQWKIMLDNMDKVPASDGHAAEKLRKETSIQRPSNTITLDEIKKKRELQNHE